MAIDPAAIRQISWASVRKQGLTVNPSLPFLDENLELRTRDDICSRLLCLLPLAAVAYGFPRERARAWLLKEQLASLLTASEQAFLSGGNVDGTALKLQIEAMWALAWTLSVSDDLTPRNACPQGFVGMLPDLQTDASSSVFREGTGLRGIDQIVSALDLYYCTHWALRQRHLEGRPPLSQPKQPVVEERRRALEWVLGPDPWDEVSLDT